MNRHIDAIARRLGLRQLQCRSYRLSRPLEKDARAGIHRSTSSTGSLGSSSSACGGTTAPASSSAWTVPT